VTVHVTRDDICIKAQHPPYGAVINSFNDGRSAPGGACGTLDISGASMFAICDPNALANSPVRTWTGGFTRGDTSHTVPSHGFNVGDRIALYMDTNTACDRFSRLTGTGQQVFATYHYATVTSTPTANTFTTDDPLRGTYDGPGCTGHSARLIEPVKNVFIIGLYLKHDASIGTGQGTDGCPTPGVAKFPKVAISYAHNVAVIGNKVERNCEAWVRVDHASTDIEVQGNWFDELNPTLFFNTEGVWVRRSARVNVHNNYFTRSNVGSKVEVGAETTSWSWNKMAQSAGYRQDERALIGGHGFWVRQTLMEGNDLDKSAEIADPFWGLNEGPSASYRNRILWNGNECDQTALLFTNTDDLCPSPGTNCSTVVLGNPDHVYATDVWFAALNAPYTIMPGPIASGSCPPLQAGSNYTLNNVVDDIYLERNVVRHPAGLVDQGTPIVESNNVVSSSPPPAWSGLVAPVSLQFTSRPYWYPASPPAGVCPWGLTGIGAMGDDFGGTLCKSLPECFWIDGNQACAPY